MSKHINPEYRNATKGDSIRVKKKTLRNIAIGISCIVLLLVTYFMVNHYVIEEFQIRDKKISDLTKQVSTLHEYLNANSSQLIDLSSQVSNSLKLLS